MKPFFFKHSGKTTAFAWVKYKAKECWFLARSVCHVAETRAASLILHNSVASKARITEDFAATRAVALDLGNARLASIVEPCRRATATQAVFAMVLFLLPVRGMKALVQAILARGAALPRTVVVFCDAHLAGVVLVEALIGLEVKTATLQHGLYRADDIGSRMAFENFVADKILMWDEITKQEFIDFGWPEARLQICGQYGFSHLIESAKSAQAQNLVAICPPYDKAKAPYFLNLANAMRPEVEIRYSLHPVLLQAYSELPAEPLASMTPRPAVAVCGDGGVIMVSLARGIPVISVGQRCLAGAHLFPDELAPQPEAWGTLVSTAHAAFEDDLRRFGFSPP